MKEKIWCVTQMYCSTYAGSANVETWTYADYDEAKKQYEHLRNEDLKSNRYTLDSVRGVLDELGNVVDFADEMKDITTDEICYYRQSSDSDFFQLALKRVKNPEGAP